MALPLEAVRTCLERGLTFVAFRWKGRTRLWIQHKPTLTPIEHGSLNGLRDRFVIAPFHNEERHLWALRPDLRLDLDDNEMDTAGLQTCQGAALPQREVNLHWDQAGHAQAIADAKDGFASGTLHKVVLARTLPLAFHSSRIPELFLSALQEMPNAFVCLFNGPEHGTWLGASPERLIHATGNHVQVDAIAGTMPSSLAPAHAKDWGAKERDEQQWVTTAIEETFISAGLTEVTAEGPAVLKAGPVAHLHTTLTARTRTGQLGPLVNALHPTPAVCGTPRAEAKQFILSHEPRDRGLYAGFWGPWMVDGETELFVNIRCSHASNDQLVLFVGGGITSGSSATHEWQETEHKARTWTRIIEALPSRIS
ncbi:MAG: chorismate-binding protein [Flavobacteriales bacterium]|nr:chorismate-binding protein [Flavobacteriales bacterium]